LWLRDKSYTKFHDIIITSNNGTTQIDHLIVSIYGIFIVETKNKTGWIFGSERQSNWTQVIYKKKYQFQNPLRQTFRQRKVVSVFLNIEESTIHPIIFFNGDCILKTAMPSNVLKSGLSRYIRKFRIPMFSEEDLKKLVYKLELLQSNNTTSKKDHIKSLEERHSSITTCPKCGSHLVLRTTKRGANVGATFLGCDNYPKCRFSKSIT